MKTNRWNLWFVAAAALVGLNACSSDSDGKRGTAWDVCETSADCDGGYACSTGRCVGDDEVRGTNNQTSGETNNATTGSSNNQTNNTTGGSNNQTNNTTGGTNNQTTGEVCPLTGAPIPADLPAVHEVTFTLDNEYPQPVWVVTEGWFCAPFDIENVGTTPGASCGCECPAPQAPHATTLRQVPADGTLELSWDGRGLVAYQECLECGAEPLYEDTAVFQPVAAGEHAIQLEFTRSLPTNCTDNGDGTALCQGQGGGESAFGAIAPPCEVQDGFGAGQGFTMPGPNDPAESIEVLVLLPVLP